MTFPSALRISCWPGLVAGLLVLLAGCSRSDEAGHWVGDVVTANDYEATLGWVQGATSLTRDHAHSGRYADHVDATHEWGITFQAPVSQVSVHALRGVAVEAWAFAHDLNPNRSAVLQVEVWAHGPGQDTKPLFSSALPLNTQLTDSVVWTPVHQEFSLPTGLPFEANLRIFLWRAGSTKPVYLDDLRVKALE